MQTDIDAARLAIAETFQEIACRRHAIISHPDAGKTTLTEELLLYGGAIQAARAVQILHSIDESKRNPILAAVGQLPCEVVQYRLQQ